jgi:hypothetical protein
MRRKARVVVAVLVAAGLSAGCDLPGRWTGDGPGHGGREVGEHVARWTEADSGEEWTSEVRQRDPVLLATQAERDTWVATLPTAADHDAVAAELAGVDLDEHVLVVGAYDRCTESSRVRLRTGDDGPVLRFEVWTDEPDTLCAWSPATLDAWAVPVSETDGVVPQLSTDD